MSTLLPVFLFLFLFITNSNATAQNSSADFEKVEASILNYVLGFYLKEPNRLEKCLHPELVKRIQKRNNNNDLLEETTTQKLILAARKGDYTVPNVNDYKIDLFEITASMASAKLEAVWGTDYFHLSKFNGQWLIVNVLWQDTIEPLSKADSIQLLDVEKQIADAIVANDTPKVSHLLTADFTFSVPEGMNITKSQLLNDIKTFWHPISQIHSEQQVKTYGNTAIITGLVAFEWGDKNKPEQAKERYSDTYVKRAGKWLRYAAHSTPQYPSKNEMESQVKTTLETLWKAWETGDKTLAEPIYDKDFIDTDFDGATRTKEQVFLF